MKQFKDDTFNQEIHSGTVLVDFYADWCGPCRMMTPVLAEVEKELSGKVQFGKVDIDANQKVATQYQVTSIPTLILFREGKEAGRLVGLRDAQGIKQFISSGK